MDACAGGVRRVYRSPAWGNALAPMDGRRRRASAALPAGSEKRRAENPAVLSSRIAMLGGLPQGAAADLVIAGVDAANLSVYTKRVFARLGILHASFHTLRHTAASWLWCSRA